jgi:hypothetical protein
LLPALEGGYEKRTPEGMKKVYVTAEFAQTATEREDDLKAVGLRQVQVSNSLPVIGC